MSVPVRQVENVATYSPGRPPVRFPHQLDNYGKSSARTSLITTAQVPLSNAYKRLRWSPRIPRNKSGMRDGLWKSAEWRLIKAVVNRFDELRSRGPSDPLDLRRGL
ncbi:hypothetical protein EYF80_053998 [Liparis tanakae]|uniref:Uncharacterized protein n=1 Tax=Liparis tanakae TaxID=230148 RepID=A0A4Z2F3Z7_9TELE|nr:hypothetical protein EYF80_053998 [Liparis tanakae]